MHFQPRSNVETVIEAGRERPSFSPLAPFSVMWRHRALVGRLAWRDISARYRGSLLGVSWAVLLPILMLTVYTFVFSVVFQARWNVGVDNKANFALVLFAGLIPFNLFAECVSASPRLVLSNPSYVKKVVFPVEILPVSALLTALFNLALSIGVLVAAYWLVLGTPPVEALTVPLFFVPLLFFTLGISWMLASLGVYLRDIQQFIGVLITILMFMSPLFYPLSSVPVAVRELVGASPLTVIIEGIRGALFEGALPNALTLSALLVGSWLMLWFGYLWFMNTKKGFADVI